MSDKQQLLKAIESLPDSANWTELTDSLLAVVAKNGTLADFARMYRTQFSAADLAEYLNPRAEVSFADVLADLEARGVA